MGSAIHTGLLSFMDEAKTDHWQKLQLPAMPEPGETGILVAEWDGRKFCLGRFQDKWFAFAYHCPHAGGVMADGDLNHRGQVLCPVHGYVFDIRTGYNSSGEGYYLRHWPVEVRSDGVYMEYRIPDE